MNILHVTNALSEGGVESLLFDLCRKTVVDGHNVTVFVLNKNSVSLKGKFESHGITVCTGNFSWVYNPLNILALRKVITQFQLVHVHLFPVQLYVALANSSLCGKKQVPLITTEHNTYNNRRKCMLLKYIDRYFYKKYKKIICISRQTEINLLSWLGSSFTNNIETISNGIDIDKFSNAENLLYKYVEVTSSIKYLVMVGRFEKPKDQLTVIKSLEFLPKDIHLIFIGTGSTFGCCQSEVNRLKVADRVRFLGYCNNVPSILKGCVIGILSTNWDGFGLAVAEYMAAGIPVLASDVDGLRDVVGNSELLFKAGDSIGLSSKIYALVNDDVLYRKMQSYCTENVNKYSINNTFKQYLHIYSSTLFDEVK